MERSKQFVSTVLSTLKQNICNTGDPLGMKGVYWTKWSEGLNLPRSGETALLTGRMYQMLPYIIQVVDFVAMGKPFLSRGGFGPLVDLGNALVGDKAIRLKALGAQGLKSTSKKVLHGIVKALSVAGVTPAYLYEDEPYSGVLLYDLGMDEYVGDHVKKVYGLLKERNVKKIIGVDPHTIFMLKEVYPEYIEGFDIEVVHYLDILAEHGDALSKACKKKFEEEFVVHDSCYMARNLDRVEPIRKVAKSLAITLKEPEATGLDTMCCGGPIEYAFQALNETVSSGRAKDLAAVAKNIVVECPICLINLNRYEQEMGVKVWDVGELLFSALQENASGK